MACIEQWQPLARRVVRDKYSGMDLLPSFILMSELSRIVNPA
jgi:hypothetical protein